MRFLFQAHLLQPHGASAADKQRSAQHAAGWCFMGSPAFCVVLPLCPAGRTVHITLSHQVSGRLGLLERESAGILNAALQVGTAYMLRRHRSTQLSCRLFSGRRWNGVCVLSRCSQVVGRERFAMRTENFSHACLQLELQ